MQKGKEGLIPDNLKRFLISIISQLVQGIYKAMRGSLQEDWKKQKYQLYLKTLAENFNSLIINHRSYLIAWHLQSEARFIPLISDFAYL